MTIEDGGAPRWPGTARAAAAAGDALFWSSTAMGSSIQQMVSSREGRGCSDNGAAARMAGVGEDNSIPIWSCIIPKLI